MTLNLPWSMKTKCYSVRLKSLESISDRAYKATAFDGSTSILPKSQVFGNDYEVHKSQAYWISAWILEKKNLQYSRRKCGWYNSNTMKVVPSVGVVVEKHVPKRIEPIKSKADDRLTRKSD